MRSIGPYSVSDTPDKRGGNANVFFSIDESGQRIAVKVCRDAHGERYKRFVREIAINEDLGDDPGVLPMLKHDRKVRHPWFSMPRAIPLLNALADREIEDAIEAVLSYACTLSRLTRTKNIVHRDIKPANLFWLNGKWLIGDFGVAKMDGLLPLTRYGNKVGAAHYMAPESTGLISESYKKNADVYSLAKTLWVAITGQNYPLPGTHEVSYRPGCVEVLVPTYRRAHDLDKILNAATAINPHTRLSMDDFALELKALQTNNAAENSEVPVDFRDLISRTKAAAREHLTEEARRKELREEVSSVLEKVTPYIEKLSTSMELLKDGFTLLRGDAGVIISTPGVDGALMFNGMEVCLNARPPADVRLHSGYGVVATTESRIVIVAGHVIERLSRRTPPVWRETREMPLKSIQHVKHIDELFEGLTRHLPQALEQLVRYFEEQVRR